LREEVIWKILTILEKRKAYNLHVESSFNVNDLIRIIIPKTTIDLLKVQKGGVSTKKKGSKSPLSSQDPNFNAQQCQYYVFQLVCKDTTIEYVVHGYLPFKYITAGFEDLIAQKDCIQKINKKIEILDEVPIQDSSPQEEDGSIDLAQDN